MLSARVCDHKLAQGVQCLVAAKQLRCRLHISRHLVRNSLFLSLVEVENALELFGVTFFTVCKCHWLYVFLFKQESQRLVFVDGKNYLLVVWVESYFPSYRGMSAEVRVKAVVIVLHAIDAYSHPASLQEVSVSGA